MSKKSETEASPLLSIDESCAYLGVGPSTLYAVIMPRTGIVKVGGRTFLRRKNLDRYLEVNTVPPVLPLKRTLGATRSFALDKARTKAKGHKPGVAKAAAQRPVGAL